MLSITVHIMVLKCVYYGESLALLQPVHRVTVILLQMCGLVILTGFSKNLIGYLIYVHIFHLALWFCWTLGKVYLRHSNITDVESKLISPHTSSMHACSIVCDTKMLHLIVISVPHNTSHAS